MTETDYAAAGTGTIPVINVSAAVNRTDLVRVAAQIHQAATQHGFFYISGHGIPDALMQRAFDASRAFFALPNAQKSDVAIDRTQRGWMGQSMSKMSGARTHDLKEVFFWGREIEADDPDLIASKPLIARNKWPDAVCPVLRKDVTPYYEAVCAVGKHVMAAIAVSLALPATFFDTAYAKPLARGQLVYYPAASAQDKAVERFGVAPHTDFGVLTLLLQDQSGGLQVRHASGEWIEAPPIPGTLVCNIGDLLARWTNDRFKSTLHRVINRSHTARYSIPVFFDPHRDTKIDPTDLGIPESDSIYPPVTAGEHIASRNASSFKQYKS